MPSPVVSAGPFLVPSRGVLKTLSITRATKARSVDKRNDTSISDSGSSVLSHEFDSAEKAFGLHLQNPIESFLEAHEQAVFMLNPKVAEERTKELDAKLRDLQKELSEAHEAIHNTEKRMEESLKYMMEMETLINKLKLNLPETTHQQNFAELSSKTQERPELHQGIAERPGTIQERSKSRQSATELSGRAQDRTGSQKSFADRFATTQKRPEVQGSAEELSSKSRGRRGIVNNLELSPHLKEFWYPVEFSSKLKQDTLIPIELFSEKWVLFRDENGTAACLRDECAHRACPLSTGAVVRGHVQCPYHGWEYDAEGSCVKMPSTRFQKDVKIKALETVESDGFIWIWPGTKKPTALPDFVNPPSGFEIHAELMLDVPVEHGLLLENLLDLAHAPFTHTSTFAKGWPIPDAVKFHTNKLLGGSWDPYPIDMSFETPCMVLSLIGLQQPGKIERGVKAQSCSHHLHQLHICLPVDNRRTRLLYRMSLDIWHWTRQIPGIHILWKNVARQVLQEDVVLVVGQQDRMLRGSSVWQQPVSYDKLAVRYRQWRNASSEEEQRKAVNRLKAMSAADIFSLEDESESLYS